MQASDGHEINFTLIAYKEDGQDTCRGHVMSRWGSKHEILCSPDPLEVAKRMAYYFCQEPTPRTAWSSPETEITILIDGVQTTSGFRETDYYETQAEVDRAMAFSVLEKLEGEQVKILRATEALAAAEEIKKKAQQEEREKQATKERERLEFERLKKIFDSKENT